MARHALAQSSTNSLLSQLREHFSEDALLTDPSLLLPYECDGLTVHSSAPLAVVFPSSADQVEACVRLCAAHKVPFAPRGAGTGLSGGALSPPGGVLIECSRMNRILSVSPEDHYAVVEPGVINAELSKAVSPFGLFYAPDPSSQLACTIGGNIAENSGGPHTLKYGTTTNHILSLEAVLPDGERVSFGKPSGWGVGYDLLGAFVGSEGTLGVVTQATVRLTPIPETVETLLAIFPDVVSACEAVAAIIKAGMLPSALEIVDRATIQIVEASIYAGGLPTDAGSILLIELDGDALAVNAECDQVRAACGKAGASEIRVAKNVEEREAFWRARKGAFGAMGRLSPDLYVHDAVVPRGKLPEVLAKICEIGRKYRLTMANVFHAGDGNLHPNIAFDRRNADELARVMAAGEEILQLCVDAGGVISGEHGIGTEKRDFMGMVFSSDDLETMQRFRSVFNPTGLCNPDKLLPSPRFCAEANPKARGYGKVPLG